MKFTVCPNCDAVHDDPYSLCGLDVAAQATRNRHNDALLDVHRQVRTLADVPSFPQLDVEGARDLLKHACKAWKQRQGTPSEGKAAEHVAATAVVLMERIWAVEELDPASGEAA